MGKITPPSDATIPPNRHRDLIKDELSKEARTIEDALLGHINSLAENPTCDSNFAKIARYRAIEACMWMQRSIYQKDK